MNDLIQHKTWLQRNKVWALLSLIVIFIGVVLFFITGFGDNATSITRIYNEPEIYEDALSQANKDSIVTGKLGTLEPIDKMALIEGSVAFSSDNRNVTITVRVEGNKGKGKMDIVADKHEGKWIYKTIAIRLKNPDERIIIAGS